jgi:hypothetical protein
MNRTALEEAKNAYFHKVLTKSRSRLAVDRAALKPEEVPIPDHHNTICASPVSTERPP